MPPSRRTISDAASSSGESFEATAARRSRAPGREEWGSNSHVGQDRKRLRQGPLPGVNYVGGRAYLIVAVQAAHRTHRTQCLGRLIACGGLACAEVLRDREWSRALSSAVDSADARETHNDRLLELLELLGRGLQKGHEDRDQQDVIAQRGFHRPMG